MPYIFVWSHEFDETFRVSSEYIIDGLTYDPERYRTYKSVRHPALRAMSAFVHLPMFLASFGLGPEKGNYSISFLDLLDSADVIQRDGHYRSQVAGVEVSGLVRAKSRKLEDRLESHYE